MILSLVNNHNHRSTREHLKSIRTISRLQGFPKWHQSIYSSLKLQANIRGNHLTSCVSKRRCTVTVFGASIVDWSSQQRTRYYTSSRPILEFKETSCFASSGSSSKGNKSRVPLQPHKFLQYLGYSDAISNGIINALLQSGIPNSSLLTMLKSLAGRYEVGEDGGLETLAASVKEELERVRGRNKVKIWFLPSTGWSLADNDIGQVPVVHKMDRAFAVEGTEGSRLTDIAKFGTSDNCDVLREYLECACSGIMACSTCHVAIHPHWYDARTESNKSDNMTYNNSIDRKKIGPPSEAELDMIDLAFEPTLTSRLGCQITLTKDLNGLVVLLPAGRNNLMDFVPFDG